MMTMLVKKSTSTSTSFTHYAIWKTQFTRNSKEFLKSLLTASDHTEALLTERNIDNVNLLLENVTNDIHDLESTYQIVQYATLTEASSVF